MSCREYQFLIGTEAELALVGNLGLQAHLETCGDCTLFQTEMRQLGKAMSVLRPLQAPAGFTERVRLRLCDN